MRAWLMALLALAVLGTVSVRAQTYASVQDAVQQLPELSLINSQVSTLPLATQLGDPNWVGSVFVPVNSAVQPLVDAFGASYTSILGNAAQINDFFAYSVVPGRALGLADLTNGASMTTLNGKTITISVRSGAGGNVISVMSARILKCCIPAGKAMLHELATLLAPPEYQSSLNMVLPADSGSNTPTSAWVSATPPSPSPVPVPSPSPSPSPAPPAPQVPSPSPTSASPAPDTSTPPASPAPDPPASSPAPASPPSTGGSTSPGGSTGSTTPAPPSGSSGSSSGSTPPAGSGGSGTTATASPAPTPTTTTPTPAPATTGSNIVSASPTTMLDTSAIEAELANAQYSAAASTKAATALLAVPLLLGALL